MALKSRWWWDLTTRDFALLDAERTVAILPVGAVEQHGPHLPVGVDAAINAGIVIGSFAALRAIGCEAKRATTSSASGAMYRRWP